ncbi:MAG: cell division protein FtsQ/DivIB [Thermosynechococcaceae cyanobacterium]
MVDPASDSHIDLIRDRQRQLKRQRRNRFLQATWRSAVILGLAVGLGWAVTQPEWKLRQQSQITITGNEKLSTASLESLLPFSFPLSLIRLEPRRIETTLQKYAHVQQAFVSRKLFPPRATIFIEERAPVAMTRCDRCLFVTDPNDPEALKIGPADTWILDDQGVALPAQSYPAFAQNQNLPTLTMNDFLSPLPEKNAALFKKVTPSQQVTPVFLPKEKQNQWQRMYRVLKNSSVTAAGSPVQLSSIDWKDLENLKLQTKLGEIHLGPYSRRFAKQLKALDEMRSLSNTVDTDQVVYIDLQNPDQPDLEMRNPPLPQEPPPT